MIFDGNVQHGYYNFVVGNFSIRVHMITLAYHRVFITWSLRKNRHFNVVPTKKSKIYYKEEGGGLFTNPCHVNVMNPKQVHDPKLVPFALSSLCTIFVNESSCNCHIPFIPFWSSCMPFFSLRCMKLGMCALVCISL